MYTSKSSIVEVVSRIRRNHYDAGKYTQHLNDCVELREQYNFIDRSVDVMDKIWKVKFKLQNLRNKNYKHDFFSLVSRLSEMLERQKESSSGSKNSKFFKNWVTFVMKVLSFFKTFT